MQPLTDRPILPLLQEQIDLFQLDNIHSVEELTFDAAVAKDRLIQLEGKLLLGADFGGDKGVVRLFKVLSGALIPQEGYKDDIQGNLGAGYVETLKRAAAFAEQYAIPFGISWGGPIQNGIPLFHPKATVFLDELMQQFGGNIKSISPAITSIINDGPAGAISGSLESYARFRCPNTIFVINGGGLGSSTVVNGIVHAEEAGHVEAVAALNTYNQTTVCGVYDAQYVCVERIGANKAGIESQWEAKTGSYMRARDIEDRYKEGDRFAGDLYEHSAVVVAHMILGIANCYDISLTDGQTAVVANGGAFKFPHYGERVAQLLTSYTGKKPSFILAKDYVSPESNACLDGAAIAAAYIA